jgi:hypothetical protein
MYIQNIISFLFYFFLKPPPPPKKKKIRYTLPSLLFRNTDVLKKMLPFQIYNCWEQFLPYPSSHSNPFKKPIPLVPPSRPVSLRNQFELSSPLP